MVTRGDRGYKGYRRSQGVTGGYKGLHRVTRGDRGLEGVTGCYNGLQGYKVTRGYKR